MKHVFITFVTAALCLVAAPRSDAATITFNFDTLADNATTTTIINYMNGVLTAAGETLRVTAVGAVTSNHGSLGSGGMGAVSNEYLYNTAAGGEFQVQFNRNIYGFSVDYVTVAPTNPVQLPDFDVTTFPGNVNVVTEGPGSSTTTNLFGNTGPIAVTTGGLFFHDEGVHDIVIDNFTIETVPEPASLTLLGTGLLGGAAWFRKRAKEQA